MKHLKSYNEGLFSDSENDEIVKGMFKKIKGTFDIDNLIEPERFNRYDYKLEETDSELGYIMITIKLDHSDMIPTYILNIDDEKDVDCSYFLKRSIYVYLKNKDRNREALELAKKKSTFADKFRHFKN